MYINFVGSRAIIETENIIVYFNDLYLPVTVHSSSLKCYPYNNGYCGSSIPSHGLECDTVLHIY